MTGLLTARAGLSAVSRVLRSLGLPGLCEPHVRVKQRARGFSAGQQAESLVLLHAAGGDCMDDMESLRSDPGVAKMLGYKTPSARGVGDFLEQFHDAAKSVEARGRAHMQGRLAFIPEEKAPLEGLRRVQDGLVRAIARGEGPVEAATIDQDATIIESRKREALRTYEGERGDQPMVAVRAETGLIMADQFRDGNVPASFAPLPCVQTAFAALPPSVATDAFQGDSACHESGLLNWLRDEYREGGPRGFIGFAVSARMSVEMAQALKNVPEEGWTTFGRDPDGTLRQWADVDFVPGEKVEQKIIQPLRYVGLRLVKPQQELFADGPDKHYHAILTNRTEDGGWLLNWHREKAGTVEHVHDAVKNGLGGGRLPSGAFGANAAWFCIACIPHNILTALRHAWPDETLRNAKPKRLRFTVIQITGRLSRDRRKITLRLAAPLAWIKHLLHVFDRFPLATQATG